MDVIGTENAYDWGRRVGRSMKTISLSSSSFVAAACSSTLMNLSHSSAPFSLSKDSGIQARR